MLALLLCVNSACAGHVFRPSDVHKLKPCGVALGVQVLHSPGAKCPKIDKVKATLERTLHLARKVKGLEGVDAHYLPRRIVFVPSPIFLTESHGPEHSGIAHGIYQPLPRDEAYVWDALGWGYVLQHEAGHAILAKRGLGTDPCHKMKAWSKFDITQRKSC